MSEKSSKRAAPTPAARLPRLEIVLRFEAAWQRGERPDLDAHLPPPGDAERLPLLIDLIHIDLERRLRAGEAVTPRHYLERFPELANAPTVLRDLEAAERGLRHQHGGRLPTIPGYEVLEELGRGNMGVVYRARHLGLDRVVALKMILSRTHAGSDERARFQREAEAAARLQHPHIVQVYELGEHDGRPYLAMELVDGGSLDKKLNRGPLPPREAARLIEMLARAVHAAHERGVVHRDLKPANVLLACSDPIHGVCLGGNAAESGHYQLKVGDFGLAKPMDHAARLSASDAIVGTPCYMAPEQAAGQNRLVGPAADTYALGAILYDILTGRPPFQAATPLETLLQVVSQEPVSPRQLNPAVDRDLETVTLKCLQKSIKARYASALALADDLRRYLDGEPIIARPVGVAERGLKWVRRHPALAALTGVSVLATATLLVLAVGLFFYTQLETANRDLAAARRGEEQQRVRAESFLYHMSIERTYSAWRENNVARAEQILAGCKQARSQWEWRYLYRLCHTELLTLQGHTDAVASVAFSPDGTRLASASGDKTVKVWDADTGQEVLTLQGHTSAVADVAFSPDGTRLASASVDRTVKVWDARTGQETLTLQGHTDAVADVAFSPDGTRLAGAAWDGTVRVWDARTGKEQLTLWGHTGAVNSVAFSRDGTRLASASWDKTVKVWDADTGQEVLTLQGHTSFVHGVAFSQDGTRLASASVDQTVKVWDAQTGQETLTLKGHTARVYGVAFSPDGRRLASASEDRTVKVWDAQTGQENLTLQGHTGAVNSVAFSRDGTRLASASFDKTVKVWDAEEVTNETQAARRLALEKGLPDWHLRKARQAVAAGQLFAALFHLDRLSSQVEPQRLVQLAEQAIEKDPDSWEYRERFGAALHRAGQFDAAVRELGKAVEQHGKGGTASTHFLLAMACQKSGKDKEARQALAKAIAQMEKAEKEDTPLWAERLRWQALRREAEDLLGAAKP